MSELSGRARGRGLFDRDPSAADQVGAAHALMVIIEMAARRGLPPISWRLGDLGSSLVARAEQYAPRDNVPGNAADEAATRVLRRAVFDAYAGLLRHLRDESLRKFGMGHGDLLTELDVWPDRTDAHGTTHLRAILKHATIPLGRDRKKWLLTLAVIAELHSELED